MSRPDRMVEREWRSLGDEPALHDVAQTLVKLVRNHTPCRNAVLYREKNQRLVAVAPDSDEPERTEPVAERAWRTGKVQRLTPGDVESTRVFPEDTQAAALPIRRRGALYLGGVGDLPFSDEQLDFLKALLEQSRWILEAACARHDLVETQGELNQSQDQLFQSSKMAAVGQLAGEIAHELHTPLAAIAMAIGGALKNNPANPERVEKRLKVAASSVDKMQSIVSKLLFYARGSTHQHRETDLNQVVEDTLQMIGHQIALDNVVVTLQLAEIPLILANHNELQQVLVNLLINARDAVLAEGSREQRIEIQTGREAEYLFLSVEDWGQGISQLSIDRLFEPFFTTKSEGKGTGLGLYVTRKLVEQHQGRIVVASTAGFGAKFTVLLPLGLKSPDDWESSTLEDP